MTGEVLKARFAAACREAGYVVLSHADGRHGPAEGLPDLLVIAPWGGTWSFVFLEFKSAREKLRPAQVRFAEAACQVIGAGAVYRVVRQTPEAPGELAARGAATCLGLVELAASLPVAGPGAVYGDSPNRFATAAPAPLTADLSELGPLARQRAEAALRRDEARKSGAR